MKAITKLKKVWKKIKNKRLYIKVVDKNLDPYETLKFKVRTK